MPEGLRAFTPRPGGPNAAAGVTPDEFNRKTTSFYNATPQLSAGPGAGPGVKLGSAKILPMRVAATMVVKEAAVNSALLKALRNTLIATGVGGIGGGIVGGATAPTDYTTEGILRGMRMGAMAGGGGMLGAQLGGGLHGLAYKNYPPKGAVGEMYRPISKKIWQGLGTAVGAGAPVTAYNLKTLSPWERGDLPLAESLDARYFRRRVPHPAGGNRLLGPGGMAAFNNPMYFRNPMVAANMPGMFNPVAATMPPMAFSPAAAGMPPIGMPGGLPGY
jgi:hypothetical protein